ncbi:MAG: leucine--tRNA ligase [candidate division Zixibacteria bacterium]|nr:leucine--tRNA ligase [candidate division Zixibacteria bacterium]
MENIKVHKQYPFDEIEPRWQKYWEENKIYQTDLSRSENKLYCLMMFIYPSGDKMHIGHWYNYGVTDSWARYKRLRGYNVFEPMGYDSFGLPAENFALKTGVHPAVSTEQNIEYIRTQLKSIGAMFDWSKELATTDPEYYRWTQWLFIKLFENGLAYRKKAPVNWCPSCKTVLANEQVEEGLCERCDNEVTRRDLTQWFFKITAYADRLLEGHKKLDWPNKTITMQKNWIGRSEGCEIIFKATSTSADIPVFTTRADTIFGVTYMVLAPEHPLVKQITTSDQKQAVGEYIEQARKQSEIERTSTVKEKTGVFTGAYAENPMNGEKIPIWTADYVLMGYGTGAVMAVPGHDERDFEFAKKFNLPISEVIAPEGGNPEGELEEAYTEYGQMVNSGAYSGLGSEEGMRKVAEYLEKIGRGGATISYRLRDWLISRQRYWGVPIPIIRCPECGDVAVPEEELPVLLPKTDDFRPAGDGSSPLAKIPEFVETTCPECGGEAKRETETMDTFVDSTWYHLRFLDPEYAAGPFNPNIVDKWMPVDRYVGGSEHAVTHLMFARFINMFLYDEKYVKFEEPYPVLRHQGIITNSGAKMSKSHGNVVIPDDYIKIYGSDTFRAYLMFMGDYQEGGDWDDSGINGIHRFLGRVWRLVEPNCAGLAKREFPEFIKEQLEGIDKDVYIRLNKTIKKFGQDFETQKYNTAIASIMELLNTLYKALESSRLSTVFFFAIKKLLWLMAPITPHLAEELYHKSGFEGSIFNSHFPDYDEDATVGDQITMVVQVNGKVRASLDVDPDLSQEQFEELAFAEEGVNRHIEGKQIIKKIFIENKLLNIVVK